MFRWGILSTAKIARDHVIPALQDAENGVVKAIASRDEERASTVARRFGIPHAFGSYEMLLASQEVDGVYIPLPTSQHVDWAIKAAEAGKHVLVEKPLALKAEDIDRVIAVRDRTKLVISEAFMVTYHPQWLKVRELLAQGAIGRLRHVQGAFTYHNIDPENMRNRPELGGGALPDIGVYPTVVTRFSTGTEPLRVRASLERDQNFGTDIYADVSADFGDFRLSFYVSTQMARRQVMVFHGDAGFIEVATPFNAGIFGDDKIVVYNQDYSRSTAFSFNAPRQYRLQAEAFARAAGGEAAELFTLEDSLRNQRVIDAIYLAADKEGWQEV